MNIQHLNLIEPIEKEIDGKTFILSKFPAFSGREIIATYSLSIIQKLSDYKKNEEIALKLMSYVAVPTGQTAILLNNVKIINSHVPSWATQLQIEAEMLDYNQFFFPLGNILTSLRNIALNTQQNLTQMSTALSEQLSQTVKPPSTS